MWTQERKQCERRLSIIRITFTEIIPLLTSAMMDRLQHGSILSFRSHKNSFFSIKDKQFLVSKRKKWHSFLPPLVMASCKWISNRWVDGFVVDRHFNWSLRLVSLENKQEIWELHFFYGENIGSFPFGWCWIDMWAYALLLNWSTTMQCYVEFDLWLIK